MAIKQPLARHQRRVAGMLHMYSNLETCLRNEFRRKRYVCYTDVQSPAQCWGYAEGGANGLKHAAHVQHLESQPSRKQ